MLTSATTSGGMTPVQGTLAAAPNTTYRIEFFLSRILVAGEGQAFLGALTAPTNASGTAALSFSGSTALPKRQLQSPPPPRIGRATHPNSRPCCQCRDGV